MTAAVQAVKSGPLGQNGVPATVPGPGGHPMPFHPLHTIAFHALDHAYNSAAAAVSFLLAAIVLGGRRTAAEEAAPEPSETRELTASIS